MLTKMCSRVSAFSAVSHQTLTLWVDIWNSSSRIDKKLSCRRHHVMLRVTEYF